MWPRARKACHAGELLDVFSANLSYGAPLVIPYLETENVEWEGSASALPALAIYRQLTSRNLRPAGGARLTVGETAKYGRAAA